MNSDNAFRLTPAAIITDAADMPGVVQADRVERHVKRAALQERADRCRLPRSPCAVESGVGVDRPAAAIREHKRARVDLAERDAVLKQRVPQRLRDRDASTPGLDFGATN